MRKKVYVVAGFLTSQSERITDDESDESTECDSLTGAGTGESKMEKLQ